MKNFLSGKICLILVIIQKIIRYKMERIKAKGHKIGTYEIDKISLSCFDGKRHILNNGIR